MQSGILFFNNYKIDLYLLYITIYMHLPYRILGPIFYISKSSLHGRLYYEILSLHKSKLLFTYLALLAKLVKLLTNFLYNEK